MDQISVVITTYNETDLLRRAFESLRLQSDKNFEVLIVNDASTNKKTNEICRDLESGEKCRVVWRDNNGGLSAARNSGFRAIKGDICVFLDADDTLPKDAITYIREGFGKAPEADFVFGNYIKKEIEEKSEVLVDCSSIASSDGFLDPVRLCDNEWILYGASPCRKILWERIGGYSQEFSYTMQDVDFWMSALALGARGFYINKVLYEWHRSKSGMNYKSLLRQDDLSKMKFKNIAFYDKFGDGISMRENLLRYFLLQKDSSICLSLAKQLIQKKKYSLYVVFVIFFQKNSTAVYHVLRKIYRFLKYRFI